MPVQGLCMGNSALGLCLAGLLLAGVAGAAEPPAAAVRPDPAATAHPREPWKWTLEERLAVRFDPVDMRRRAKVNEEDNDAPPYPEGTCVIEGDRDPELLMPDELFSNLLDLAFLPNDERRAEYRKEILEKGRVLGFDEKLWPVLKELARDQLRSMEEFYEAVKRRKETGKRSPGLSPEEQLAICAQRKRNREAVRAYFGGERFDRFLYEVIAPGAAIFMPPNPNWPEQLRFIDGGCQ